MACKICDSDAHNRRKCTIDVTSITPQQLWEIRRSAHQSVLDADKFKYGPWRDEWKKLPEWRQRQVEDSHAELVKLKGGTTPIIEEQPTATIPVIEETPAPTEKRIVIVASSTTRSPDTNALTIAAITRGAPPEWKAFVAFDRSAGVRLAIAIRAHHVVLVEDTQTDKATLRTLVDRLRLAVPGVHVAMVYDYDHEGQTSKDLKTAGHDVWINPNHPEFKSSITGSLAEWEPRESQLRNWQPWTAPASVLRVSN